MHSVRLEPTKMILIGTRTTYQATGDGYQVDLIENPTKSQVKPHEIPKKKNNENPQHLNDQIRTVWVLVME